MVGRNPEQRGREQSPWLQVTARPEWPHYSGLGCPRNKQKKSFGPTETNQNKICFGLFRETKNKNFWFVSVCFGVSNLYRNNRNKQNCFETNRNNPKFSAKKTKYALFQTVSVGLLFVSVQSKHQNSLLV
jgi:hypothetical protein